MIYEILTVVLVLYVLITPYFYVKCIKWGVKLGESATEATEEPVVDVQKKSKVVKKKLARKKKEAPKVTPHQDYIMQILANVDRYDGTPNGQKPVVREK